MKHTLLLIALFTMTGLSAQRGGLAKQRMLEGTWSLVHARGDRNDTLVLRKITTNFRMDGSEISFSPDGKLVKLFKPNGPICGNDTRLYSRFGQWSVDKAGNELTTSVPVFVNRKRFEIIGLTQDTLVLYNPDDDAADR